MAKKYSGVKSLTLNTLSEDIFYAMPPSISKMSSLIYPVMAGITPPDPSYFVQRYVDGAYPYLFVLEYVTSGKGYIEYNNKKYTVKAGDFYMFNRYTAPYYYPDPKEPFSKMWVNITGRFMNSLAYAYRINEPVLVVHHEGAGKHISEIHEILRESAPLEASASYNRIMQILLDLFMEIDTLRTGTETTQNSVSFHEITEYITTNIVYERLSVDYISTYFFMSYSSLYRMCMKNVGMSPKHYILKLKIEYAQNLFLTTKCSVAQAAERLGFSSPVYFRNVFKKYSGVSPAKWRKQQKDVASK